MTQRDQKSHLTAAIIAGGKSVRFGSKKVFASLNDRSLIEHAVNLAQKISQKTIIIVADKPDFTNLNHQVFVDIIPERGPMGGLYTALTYAETSLIATLPCDLPLLPPELYLILLQHLKESIPAVAVSHSGLEPLVAIWPKTILPDVEHEIQQNQFKMHLFLKKMGAVEVSIPDLLPGYEKKWFVNVNTLADLKKIEE